MDENRLFIDIENARGLVNAAVYDNEANVIGEVTGIDEPVPGRYQLAVRIFDIERLEKLLKAKDDDQDTKD